MSTYRNLITLCAAAVFALGLAACSSGGDAPTEPEVTMPDPVPTPDPGPTDLEETQMAAAAAATAASDAATAAAASAMAAADATANIATLQTGEAAMAAAMGAHDAATEAADAYAAAKAASEAAAAATTGPDAEAAWAMAVSAQGDAEDAAATAAEMSAAAIEAASTELHIDGTVKSVGDSSVDAMSGPSSVATGSGDDAKTVVTGLIASMNPMGTSGPIDGSPFVPATVDDLTTEADEREAADATKGSAYKQAAAARTFAIGKTLDSSDDMARLMIVTHYPDTNMVRVFSEGDTTADALTGTKAGYISINVTATADVTETNNVSLRSEGMFVPVSGGTAATLVNTDSVAATAKPVEVFSYIDPNDDTNTRVYATLRETSTTTSNGTTTYSYTAGADIVAADAAADGPDTGAELDAAQVTVAIPGPVAYEHLHFGVWAGLGDANAAGDQDVTDSNIGFVQSIGDGMTGADMPNAGSATYSGNWVAVVLQGAGDDSMALEHGAADLTADFGKATLEADLNGLATLTGTMDGSSFAGTTATAAANNSYGLTPGAFEGEFSGAFFGSKAAEAGGVFDFDSANSGAFRGAFGGAKDD